MTEYKEAYFYFPYLRRSKTRIDYLVKVYINFYSLSYEIL